MIGGIGGVVGGTFHAICQMPFIHVILLIAIYLVWKCFRGDCWFENCGRPDDFLPAKEARTQRVASKKEKDLYAKIEEIVQKNIGVSVRDLVSAHGVL